MFVLHVNFEMLPRRQQSVDVGEQKWVEEIEENYLQYNDNL